MTKSRLKIALLALLLIVPTASRVAAGDDPTPPPKARKEKKIVVKTPEQKIVVDGDEIVLPENFDDAETFADLSELQDLDLPGKLQWMSGGGYIGVRPIPMTGELRKHFGAPEDAGVFVGSVEKDGPAAKAGLAVGDILTAVDGEKIASPRQLARAVRRKKEGESVKIDFLRDRASRSLTVSVAQRQGEEIHIGDLGHGWHGRRWRFEPPEPPEAPMAPVPPRWRGLEDRIRELEQRIQELEGRLPR